jgi:hypothetical protein
MKDSRIHLDIWLNLVETDILSLIARAFID